MSKLHNLHHFSIQFHYKKEKVHFNGFIRRMLPEYWKTPEEPCFVIDGCYLLHNVIWPKLDGELSEMEENENYIPDMEEFNQMNESDPSLFSIDHE